MNFQQGRTAGIFSKAAAPPLQRYVQNGGSSLRASTAPHCTTYVMQAHVVEKHRFKPGWHEMRHRDQPDAEQVKHAMQQQQSRFEDQVQPSSALPYISLQLPVRHVLAAAVGRRGLLVKACRGWCGTQQAHSSCCSKLQNVARSPQL